MKQTEEEYAEMLIEQYGNTMVDDEISVIFAINDVNNTIEALVSTNLPNDTCMNVCSYYENVLQILKDKL